MEETKAEFQPEYVDVLVIGSGLAGLAAAYEAAAAGAKTKVLEKMGYCGGNSALAGGGYACWNSRLDLRHKLGLGEDSWQKHAQDTMEAGKNQSVKELVEVLAKNAPSGLDWLCDRGVAFKNILVKLGGYSAPRCYQSSMSGKQMIDCIKKAVETLGVEIKCGCEVNGINRNDMGEVDSVRYACGGKAREILVNKAVIISSGGFSRDVKMRRHYCPQLDERCNCSNHPGATGEVIRYAKKIGAGLLHMDCIQLYPCANPVSGAVDRWAFYCYSGAGFGMIYTDGGGKRFISETKGRDELSGAQISGCKKPTWSVFNKPIADALGMTDHEIELGEKMGRMKMGETIKKLAEAMEADAESLESTIKKHNAAIKNKGGDEYGAEIGDAFIPMEEGPFYAIAQWPAVHYTMGGLRIDTCAHVLDEKGKIIPRLYAAGEVVGGVHGANRMGGNALAECVVFGRIAGQNAAKM